MNEGSFRGAWFKPIPPVLRFVVGLILGVFCVLASLIIWIGYFDSDGGEPGASTIFGSLMLWPIFLAFVVGGGALSGLSRRFFYLLGLITITLVIWAAIMVTLMRRENAAKRLQYSFLISSPEQETSDGQPEFCIDCGINFGADHRFGCRT
ncbi:MAG: hypothetical protein AAF911_14210 [Planctomycetota bacterium]